MSEKFDENINENTDELENVESHEAEQTQNELQEDEQNASESEDSAQSDEKDETIAVLNKENESLKEQMLRVQADMQNVRRRAELDVEKAHKFGLEKMATQLLNVVDNLERALAAAGDDEATKALRDGVKLTLDEFSNTLEKFNILVINPEGEPFNPEHHQAISMVENKEVEPNSVIAVMQKGYSLNGRLLRPAMVMVSKGSPSINETA